jgi:quercetin dioxygenase-like cupin family protein
MDTIVEDRGRIIPVAEGDFKTVLLIESKKGAVRANHWHKRDTHIMHMLSGKARYVETGINEAAGIVLDRVVGPGDQIVTGPNVPHAMEFLEDSVMIVCSNQVRDEKTYLSEIVPCKVL